MEVTDEHIAQKVQDGDTDAFGDLITKYEEKLRRYARRFLNYEHEIDDLVQDVFIKAYTNIQSFDTDLRFSPWIYRIAHNTFVNELKRKSRAGLGYFDADTILPHLPAKETTDADILNQEIQAEMETFIQDLPPKYREVLILYYYEELSYQEISDVLTISISTVGVRMTRARQKLKEDYQKKQKNHG